ncbi:MAG: DUF4037 domain-containing protein [Erysipelotrichaceae bacterium]|nr:DUF4037 domain-containing protein [Erysipelotrichaceae bacterium]
MKGLDLAEGYYREYGEKMLREQFPFIMDKIAVGLFGSGSECYGYDDEISRDHDWEPGFIILVPDDTDEKTLFQLERAYNKLPREYQGFKRQLLSPVGGNRHGVFRIGEYFEDKIGSPDGNLTVHQWLTLPQYCFCEATNGRVFLDCGLLETVRERLLGMPSDILKKRLAGNLLMMAQSGQYNYERCLRHGEKGAAQLAADEFVRSALEVIFLLNRCYMPFYKWSFRALRDLPVLPYAGELLEQVLTDESPEIRIALIDNIARLVSEEVVRQGLAEGRNGDLERLAYQVNDRISDAEIRNLSILATR